MLLSIIQHRIRKQIKSVTEATCSASIRHSANVHCYQFHLMKTMYIENTCAKGYARNGTRYFTCQNITSDCIPCKCNINGSDASLCNSETGQCQCRDHFVGKNCEIEVSQDCKWTVWTSWSECSKACGIGGEQKRSRKISLKRKGRGKSCKGKKEEKRKCFKRCICCDGTFYCNDSLKCSLQMPTLQV